MDFIFDKIKHAFYIGHKCKNYFTIEAFEPLRLLKTLRVVKKKSSDF